MKRLLIAAAVLALPLGAQAVSMPGFCAKGIGSAEAKVCQHPGSAESEGLVFALYRAALEKLDAGPSKELQEQHTKWWDSVKACAESKDMNGCINNAYGTRMLQLQSSYKLVKTTGPVAFTCSDGSKISATFFDTTPASMVAARNKENVLLRGERTASGIAYGNRSEEFKEHQGKVTIKWGAKAKELSCKKS
ncbi:MliC family protein [Massilia sp. CFBP9012]|uniref:MliC family protein n=1 Tax=Massilia sp. CFBP9012 TaxID=3096531 RepID=UPI002A6B67D5|nr:MliC family protein [Massilia sp. CFBP9012]MDY0973582.1 MliC family protein [Massilia sp. CFBP9012]